MAAQRFHHLQFLFILLISPEGTEGHVSQSPFFKQVKKGGSVSINCAFSDTKGSVVGAYLRRNLSNPIDLAYIYKETNKVQASYTNRLVCEGNMENFIVTLNNLHENDTDIYYCIFGIRDSKVSDYSGQGTMLLVSGSNMESCANSCVRAVSYKDPIVIGVIVTAILAIH